MLRVSRTYRSASGPSIGLAARQIARCGPPGLGFAFSMTVRLKLGMRATRESSRRTSRLSQPAWQVTRTPRAPWRIESECVLSAWARQCHIAVSPGHVPPSRRTKVRSSSVGLLRMMDIADQASPPPLPLPTMIDATSDSTTCKPLDHHRSAIECSR